MNQKRFVGFSLILLGMLISFSRVAITGAVAGVEKSSLVGIVGGMFVFLGLLTLLVSNMVFKFKTLERRVLNFKGKPIEYKVVDRNVGFQTPKYFVGYKDPEEKIPFVSDEVPKEYLERIVRHEVIENEVYGKEEDKCLRATIEELKTVPKSQMKAYLAWRAEVFESLINYYNDPSRKGNPYNERIIKEAEKSLKYLKEKMSKYKQN